MKKNLSIFASLLMLFIASINASEFELGEEYDIVAPKESQEPVIEEFFNYACGACYGMEQLVSKIKSDNKDIPFKLVPVELNPSWKIYVKAYFLGEKLNLLDKSHSKLFHRLHVEKKPLKNEADMKEFFLQLGADEKEYDSIVNSYWINTQMRMAKQYAMKLKVISTPTFVINKRYKLNNKKLATPKRIDDIIKEFTTKKS